jgi:hypothetical protein
MYTICNISEIREQAQQIAQVFSENDFEVLRKGELSHTRAEYAIEFLTFAYESDWLY